jgi:hypothetical protein
MPTYNNYSNHSITVRLPDKVSADMYKAQAMVYLNPFPSKPVARFEGFGKTQSEAEANAKNLAEEYIYGDPIILNIPADSKRFGNIISDAHFEASLYELENGTIAAFIIQEENSTDKQISAENRDVRIRNESCSCSKGPPSYYIVKRVPAEQLPRR